MQVMKNKKVFITYLCMNELQNEFCIVLTKDYLYTYIKLMKSYRQYKIYDHFSNPELLLKKARYMFFFHLFM